MHPTKHASLDVRKLFSKPIPQVAVPHLSCLVGFTMVVCSLIAIDEHGISFALKHRKQGFVIGTPGFRSTSKIDIITLDDFEVCKLFTSALVFYKINCLSCGCPTCDINNDLTFEVVIGIDGRFAIYKLHDNA